MDINEIHSIIKKLVKSGAAEVSFEIKDLKLTVKNHPKYPPIVNTQPPIQIDSQPNNLNQIQNPIAIDKKNEDGTPEGLITIKSPMVGIFYRKPAPDKPLYVNVGDTIKKGTIVCLIEAMKLFNEIESDIGGKIVKTMIDDGIPVEYDQPLFLIEPIK